MKKTLKRILPLLICFVAINASAQQSKKERFEKLKTELELNEEQAMKVKQILKQRDQAIKASKVEQKEGEIMTEEAMKEAKEKHIAIKRESNKAAMEKMKEVLTAEQLGKYKGILKQKRELKKEKKMEKNSMPKKVGLQPQG